MDEFKCETYAHDHTIDTPALRLQFQSILIDNFVCGKMNPFTFFSLHLTVYINVCVELAHRPKPPPLFFRKKSHLHYFFRILKKGVQNKPNFYGHFREWGE